MEKTIEIPEGYEARIEGNKVILEPKESKDERIRKGLLRHFKNKTKPYWNEIAVKDIIAYLERQKEQQPANDRYMDGYAKGYKDAENSYNRGVSYHFDNPNIQRLDPNVVIESQTGGTYPDILKGTLTGGESIEDKDAIEPTPKQDYSGLTDFERAIHRGFLCAGMENVPVGIIKDTAQECLAQIKPAGWSEEDEKKLTTIISLMRSNRAIDPFYDKMCLESWLKSLRPNHWKPSEEDFAELTRIKDSMPDNEWGNQAEGVLDELIENLKKL